MIFSFTNRRPLATLALAATAFATLASVAAASSNSTPACCAVAIPRSEPI